MMPNVEALTASMHMSASAPFADADLIGVVDGGLGTYDECFADDGHVYIARVPGDIACKGVVDIWFKVIEHGCKLGAGELGEDVCEAWALPSPMDSATA
jgi:hypothetical protein